MDLITNWMFDNLVLTGAGAVAIVFILTRLISNERLNGWFGGIATVVCKTLIGAGTIVEHGGKALTFYGRSKVGIKFWEKIEDFIENGVWTCYISFMNVWRENFKENLFEYYWFRFKTGLHYDNGNEEKKNDDKR